MSHALGDPRDEAPLSGTLITSIPNHRFPCTGARGTSLQTGHKGRPGERGMATGERLAREFFGRVWAPPHDLAAIDELMTPDYRITTAGQVVEGREAFKRWVGQMQTTVGGATNEHLEVFENPAGDRVVSRWITRGTNEGMFGLPADGRPVQFSGIAIWRVEGDRLAECWVERSALELLNQLREGGRA